MLETDVVNCLSPNSVLYSVVGRQYDRTNGVQFNVQFSVIYFLCIRYADRGQLKPKFLKGVLSITKELITSVENYIPRFILFALTYTST